jgi:hypothetical protein
MGYSFSNEYIDAQGNVTVVESGDIPFWPLEPEQVAIVLLICKGFLTLNEGVNVTGLPGDHLVHEAQSWAVAAEL